MKFIIVDWMYNVCFGSDMKDFKTLELYIKCKWDERYPRVDFIELYVDDYNLFWIPVKNGMMILNKED